MKKDGEARQHKNWYIYWLKIKAQSNRSYVLYCREWKSHLFLRLLLIWNMLILRHAYIGNIQLKVFISKKLANAQHLQIFQFFENRNGIHFVKESEP
ncbi:unnamed protein product [Blepharisma stoltei]|uniref:Ribosomal protein L20 n=1 Tax=Blepharisma stoltei TaxID=1481888 RepID=A0AAU9K279_9CILI|nr:unnamed protein product [Blepharisma stoltei]